MKTVENARRDARPTPRALARRASLVAIVAAACATATVADAQTLRYYARQRISGLAERPSYGIWTTGAWTSTCSGSTRTQTRTVACSTSTCDPATRPTNSQAVGSCAFSCGSLTGGRYAQGGSYRSIGRYASQASAQSACEAAAVSGGSNAVCNWNALTYSGAYQELSLWSGTTATAAFGDPEFYAAVCSWK